MASPVVPMAALEAERERLQKNYGRTARQGEFLTGARDTLSVQVLDSCFQPSICPNFGQLR